ncbi:MAG: hypothetical protein QM619_01535 [Micropruina sp.]|uniref:hypothetical protein n=1 Tax=Micropruina sp. TaxID=2737536 RepID=UPI0039E28CC3
MSAPSHQPFGSVQAERWLSAPRYRRYLNVASGDHGLATDVYLWNSRVAAAGIVDVWHHEIAVRNTYDRELIRRFPDCAIDPQSRLFRKVRNEFTIPAE